MAAPRGGTATRDPVAADFVLLAVAVAAVSTSAPLIRYAAAPALAISFWRNALAVPPLAIAAARSPWPARRERRLIAASGLLLALHFALWIPSISYTSVASSVALVATQPVWAAIIARWRGEEVARGVWIGIGIALIGVVVLSGVDLSLSGRALFGDMLALAGGVCSAAYVTVGAEVRRTVGTSTYAAGAYLVAAVALLVMTVVAGRDLVGFDAGTWVALVALTIGAQLFGHTLFNRVLDVLSPTVVSVAILFEIVGASVIAVIAFDETPPLAAAPAAALILAGVIVVIRSGRRRVRDVAVAD